MKQSVTIALDAMGGDHGPAVVVPAALEILGRHEDVSLVLVGDRSELEARCGDNSTRFAGRLRIHHTTQLVAMDESPSAALRGKKDSSMRVAIDLVKKGEADACVSAGNTGALMATARFVLKMLPGIDRPAIISAIPSMRGHTHVLDLGANVDLDAGQLFQLAVMGSTLVRAVENVDRPRVGLLNVGAEEIKGNEEVKKAHTLLSACSLNYIGFVEGDDVNTGDVDVIVCDGFVGNVALKTSEGLARMISHFMREAFSRNLLTRMAALIASPALRSFKRRIDPRRYNGASLVGLQGIVIKSHGGADAFAFAHAIDIARIEVAKAVPETIGEEIGHLMEATGTT